MDTEEKKELVPLKEDQFIADTYEEHTAHAPITCSREGHEWVRVSGGEAKCRKCTVGMYIPPRAEIKELHIYLDEQLLV